MVLGSVKPAPGRRTSRAPCVRSAIGKPIVRELLVGDLPPPSGIPRVHGLELGGGHAVPVSAVAIVVDEVVSLAIAGGSLLRFDAAGFRGHLCPYGRLLHIAAPTDLLVRLRKDRAGHRVDIAVVVDQPVPPFASLPATPFLIGQPIGLEVEPHGDDGLTGLLPILQSLAHHGLMRRASRTPSGSGPVECPGAPRHGPGDAASPYSPGRPSRSRIRPPRRRASDRDASPSRRADRRCTAGS